jgi:regulator of protease activity HflC (stomatin/prohibitin superfamily)
MAEIRRYPFRRHLRSDASSHVLHFRRTRLLSQGRGLACWFRPMTDSLAEVPVDDRELTVVLHGRSADFQDISAQAVITYRVADPVKVAARVDFTLDLYSGTFRQKPLESITQIFAQMAQQYAWDTMAGASLRQILASGQTSIRDRIGEGLRAEGLLEVMGLELVSVRVSAVKPTPDLEKALETPMREEIKQEADEAAFQRRALAVEKERAIQDNELQNRIELARREQHLIDQEGQNARRRATETAATRTIAVHSEAEARRVESEAAAQEIRVQGQAQAESLGAVEGIRVELEGRQMAVLKSMPPAVIFGLACRELAGKLQRIDHLNLGTDLIGPLLANLLEAGAKRLAPGGQGGGAGRLAAESLTAGALEAGGALDALDASGALDAGAASDTGGARDAGSVSSAGGAGGQRPEAEGRPR